MWTFRHSRAMFQPKSTPSKRLTNVTACAYTGKRARNKMKCNAAHVVMHVAALEDCQIILLYAKLLPYVIPHRALDRECC